MVFSVFIASALCASPFIHALVFHVGSHCPCVCEGVMIVAVIVGPDVSRLQPGQTRAGRESTQSDCRSSFRMACPGAQGGLEERQPGAESPRTDCRPAGSHLPLLQARGSSRGRGGGQLALEGKRRSG